jgi:hypothetical protein
MSELDPDAQSIVDAARPFERPTDTDRTRVRHTLMRAIAAGAAAAATAGTGAAASAAAAKGAGATGAAAIIASGTASVAGKVIVILMLAGAVSAGAVSLAGRLETPADTRPSAIAAPQAAPAPLKPTPSPAELSGVLEGSSPKSEPEPSDRVEPPAPVKTVAPADPRAQSPSAAPTPAAESAAEDPLDVETRSLGEAHSALQSGDAARALALLDKQSATHAQGELRQERAAARVVALCKLGRMGEARTAADSFMRENPRSPLTDRVRAACPSSPIQ